MDKPLPVTGLGGSTPTWLIHHTRPRSRWLICRNHQCSLMIGSKGEAEILN
jgi:hypothetical protein